MHHRSDSALRDRRGARRRGSTGWIKRRQHAASTRMPSDSGNSAISDSGCGGGRLCAIAAGTAVDITHFNPALLVDRDVKKIEQVTANVGAAAGPDAAALNRRVRRSIAYGPGSSAIEGMCDVKMPGAVKSSRVRAARRGGAIKSNGGAPGIAGDSRRIPDIFQAQRGTHVEDVIPGAAVVVTGGYDQRAIGIGDGKIDAAIVVNPNRRIAVPGNGRDAVIPNVPDMPGYSVIFRDYDRAVAAAVIVR